MATVLVTGAGGACGIGAIQSLKTETNHRIIGVDMDAAAVGLYFADDGQSVPPAADDAWAEEMATVVEEFSVDVILPTVDEELAALPSLAHRLPDDVPIVAPNQEVIGIAMDKYRTMERLSTAGHPVPETWLATECAEIDSTAFPLMVKPRQGRGSRGVRKVETPEELTAYVDETDYPTDALLCQEYIDGTEYTTSVVGTKTNRLLSVVPKEAITKDGSTVLGATRHSPAVADACVELFESLEPAGPLNVQQIVDEDGIPHVIEINPRFSSTSCLTVAAGINEFDLLIRDALGEQVDPQKEFIADRYILRYDGHLFADADEFDGLRSAGDADSKLLTEKSYNS